ncbi:hypothetical protein [Hymenobacter sp. J193]|nr:hypothetical protein [Hymenobacter sp. J193]
MARAWAWYLVQRIVSSQGGHLAVTSIIGEGTTFTIHWNTPSSSS